MARTVDTREKKKLISYRYEALAPQGRVVKGTIKAATEIAAERLIVERGYNPTVVEQAPSMLSLEEALPTFFKVKPRDVIIFSRQLATLLKAGITLLPALEIQQGQVAASRAFRRILGVMINDIRAGSSFSDAICKHPKAFMDIFCRTVAVGEQTGGLETVLNQMADYMEKQSAMARKIGKALTYPIMVLGVGVGVVVVLMTIVLPNLLGMFTAMKVELPLPTRILIGMTNFFTGFSQLYLVIAVALLAVIALTLMKQPTGRRLLDRFRLIAPIIGPPTLFGELARFSRTVSMLVGSGMSLQDILEVAPQSTNNRVFRDALKRLHEALLLGEGLSEPMHRLGLFPPLLIQMVIVGEESNTLDFTMKVVADFYETTADEKLTALVGLIGPLSTIVIALVVGFLALAIVLPIYTLTGAFG